MDYGSILLIYYIFLLNWVNVCNTIEILKNRSGFIMELFTLKKVRSQFDPPWTPVLFPKMYLLERGWSPGSFIINFYYYQNSHLSWKFHWNSLIVQKIWRFSPSMITTFINFPIFGHFLVTKKLMKSAYNRSYQHIFTFNLNKLFNNCIKLYWY